MNKKSLLLVTSSLFICVTLCAKDEINNRYSDDDLFNKEALDRMIPLNGTCIKKVEPSSLESQQELDKNQLNIQEIDGLIGALDELEVVVQPQACEKKSKEIPVQAQKIDTRHAVAIIKHVIALEVTAQKLFQDALPSVKKRSYGYLWRDLGNATTKIWSDDLAKQVFYHPSFRLLNPKAQQDLILALNKRFTEYFRSFVMQNVRNEVQAKDDFARFYQTVPKLMTKVLKQHYRTLDISMIDNK